MPRAAPRPCVEPGCNAMATERGRCAEHAKRQQQQLDARRGSSSQRGYGSQWQKARAGFLRSHPLCLHCQRQGKLVPATDVDHIQPHKGDRALFWDSDNWQGLCKPCHSAKTATEDGRWS
ncbi:MAG: HNH endonuclease [Rubrivivax sp.]|nr:HNH endonuclease [Rubrivivax sp.]